jgi:hypothetical protein
MKRVVAAAFTTMCAVIAIGASGCGDDDSADAGAEDPATSSASPEQDGGLQAFMERSTLFDPVRALAVRVRYEGEHDVQLGAIQLRSPLFEPVAPQRRDPIVRAGGGLVTMPLQFGAARCDAKADGPPELLTDADGHDVVVAIEENPSGLLEDLHARECAVAAVRADVELRFADNWVPTGPTRAEGDLELVQRHPGVAAALDELQGNVVFNAETGSAGDTGDQADPLVEVSDDQPSGKVHVAISASRCDPHALIEYKRTFIFVAWIALGDGEPVRVDIEADGEARRVLEAIRLACLD